LFDVFSVKRMYNIKVSTGKNTWFLVKIDDDDDDDDDDGAELGYSFLNVMSLVQPLISASSVVLLKLSVSKWTYTRHLKVNVTKHRRQL